MAVALGNTPDGVWRWVQEHEEGPATRPARAGDEGGLMGNLLDRADRTTRSTSVSSPILR
jgi:hypothetical protein